MVMMTVHYVIKDHVKMGEYCDDQRAYRHLQNMDLIGGMIYTRIFHNHIGILRFIELHKS